MDSRRSPRPARRLRIEALEDRAVPAISTSFDTVAARLIVRSDAADPVVVTAVGPAGARVVAVNGRRLAVAADAVRALDVRGGPGPNRINLSAVTPGTFPALTAVEADGGAGKDTLVGSALADDLAGGPDADVLRGLAGDDTLRGGGGTDLLVGGAGDDLLQSSDPVEAGFNDASGLNADPTADSPYRIGGTANGRGAAEPGWAGPWVQTVGADGLAVVQGDTAFEGDGALRVSGGTAELHRTLAQAAATGILTVTQWVFVPAGGNVTAYVFDGSMEKTAGTAAQWNATAGHTFAVVDAGFVEDTGIPVPVQQWVRVDVRVDMDARTWDFFVDGVRFAPPDPLDFRGSPGAVDTVNYLVESLPGIVLDAVQVDGPDAAFVLPRGDTLSGGLGSDTLRGASGPDVLFGGPGGDSVAGGPAADRVYGGADGDDLAGDAGDDRLWGEAGDDTVRGGEGSDRLYGGLGIDALAGGRGPDTLFGGDGADALDGEAGADFLLGGPGDDTLGGGSGNDRLAGQGGNDLLRGGGEADRLDGGLGNDRLESADPPPSAAIVAGFNDAEGANADSTPNSPYRLGSVVAGAGAGEPGWAIPWQHPTGPQGNAIVQSAVVFEGDGALQMAGGTTAVYRDWVPAEPAGVVTVSQMIYVPAGGGLQQYIQDGTGPNVETATAAQWACAAGLNFGVLDSGVWEDTGIPTPVGAWTAVTIRVDMTARTYDFLVNGVPYAAPDPLGFRGNPGALNRIVFLLENVPGFYVDDIRVAGPDPAGPPETLGDTLSGGPGNDTAAGGRGNDLVLGGGGTDALDGGDGRDLIVGGTGPDTVTAGAGEDILIAGFTVYDAHAAALPAILAEWSSTRDVATRTANISGTGTGPRLNGAFVLTPATVRTDAAPDSLAGGPDADWFFVRPGEDLITDLAGEDQVTDL